MTRFARRLEEEEWMDDHSIDDARLRRALHELRTINRWLGGHSSLWSAVEPYLSAHQDETVRLLDIGTGIGDIPELLVRRTDNLEVTAVDANPATVDYAREWLDGRLPGHRRRRITLVAGDLFSLPFASGTFHLCTASLFLHHLDDRQAVHALELMDRLGADGLVVNDLHRTRAAYYGLRLILRLFSASDMVRHDGPRSVLRGFHRDELDRLARRAGTADYRIEWRWAFRWILSTINL